MFTSVAQPLIRVADKIYEQLLSAIHDGTISTDQRLVQEKLAEQFGISRTPVREALLRLEQEGIIEVAGRTGFRLREIDQSEVMDIYVARAAVEAEGASILARRNDAAEIEALRQLVVKEESISDESVGAYYRANHAIHAGIMVAAGNRYLVEMDEGIWNRGFSYRLFAAIHDENLAKSLGDHIALIDAIATSDPDHASAQMRAHIYAGLDLHLTSM